MKTLIAIDTITWIDRLHYASDEASLNIHLDPSLSPLGVYLEPGPYAEDTWQEFLSLTTVHCFERGGHTYAYNFAKVEQAVLSARWGNFVFSREQGCAPLSTLLEPLHAHGLDMALPAYRLWLHTQAQREPSLHLQALLTILVPAERCDQESERLDSLFPGIMLRSTSASLWAYCWGFPLNTWLTEEQTMFLGLYEHVIRFPGVEQEAWPQRMLPSLFLPLSASLPLQAKSHVREAHSTSEPPDPFPLPRPAAYSMSEPPNPLPFPRPTRIRFRRLLAQGTALSCVPIALFAWFWLRRDADTKADRQQRLQLSQRALPMHQGRKNEQRSRKFCLARQLSRRAGKETSPQGMTEDGGEGRSRARQQHASNR